MKSRTLTSFTAMTLFAALAIPVCLAAQENPDNQPKHQRYILVDLGTFGGPGGGIVNPSAPALNNRGTLVGVSSTSIPDPFAPDCFLDCFVDRAWVWNNGRLIKLPTLPGGGSSIASSINESGQIAGQAQNGAVDALTGWPESNAVVWHDRRIVNLGTLGGTQSNANANNDRGQVVGGALNMETDPFANTALPCFVPCPGGTFAQSTLFVPATTQVRAFLWTEDEGMRDLGTLGGPDSNAWIINDRGQVAGQSFTSFTANSNGVPTVDPFFWEDGKMTDIGSLGGTYGFAAWLNNRGQVVGDSNLAGDTTQEPFLWSAATGIRNLGSLGGNFGFANSINEDGEVVGLTSTPQALVGFLWKDGVMTNLGTIGSDFGSEAYSINSKGQIVGGTFPFGGGDLRGFLWENGGPMVDLNTLLVQPTTMYVNGALIINDRGEIGCLGKNPGDTTTHACVLIPCDNNHSGVEGCEDADTTSVTPSNPLAVTQTSTDASQSTLSPEMLAARARIGGRYHTLGVPH